ncbi:MAG: helix-turn-helix transcriptional regulator [Myxococcaceae bacterium]|nr:helix-turn-helix transcriptional regulator [Myxococcaceae bacterium]
MFEERGFEATTMRELARASGVAVGTVFVHFSDKGALLSATLHDQVERALVRAAQTLPPRGAREQVLHLLGALFKSYAKRPVLSRVLVKELLFPTGAARAEARDKVSDFLAQLRALCSAPGALAPRADPGAAAEAIFAAYLAALVDGLGRDRPRPAEQLALVDRLIEPWFQPRSRRRSS